MMYLKKTLLLLICCTWLQYCFSQNGNIYKGYLDADEKPVDATLAIYYVKVLKKNTADLLWTRNLYGKADNGLKSSGFSTDSAGMIKQGDYIIYYNDGNKYQAGRYENGKKEGAWTNWYTTGILQAKNIYHQDKMTGSNRSWYETGNILDSSLLNNNGDGMGYGFYESGQRKYDGVFTTGDKSGVWHYYYDQPGNHKSMDVLFKSDSLISNTCYTPDGVVQSNCIYEKEAEFKNGENAWRTYLGEALGASNYTKFMKDISEYKVIIKFVVSKDGKIKDVHVENSDKQKLDNIAERIIRNSPDWEPAIQYNQKVNAYRRQPLTFVVTD